jgi:hypothetical protein
MTIIKLTNGLVVPEAMIDAMRAVRETTEMQILMLRGFIPANITPCPNCLDVPGAGKLSAAVGDRCDVYYMGGARLDRELMHWPCPVCAGEGYVKNLIECSGVVESNAPIWSLPGRLELETAVRQQAEMWQTTGPSGWLTFVGPHGSGKTWLAKWLVRQACYAKIAAQYVLVPALSDQLYNALDNQRLPQVLSTYSKVPVLALDQLDWQRQYTAYDRTLPVEKLIQMLDGRYNARDKLATILVVNRPFWEEGGGEFAPIVSRAREGIVFVLNEGVQVRGALGTHYE